MRSSSLSGPNFVFLGGAYGTEHNTWGPEGNPSIGTILNLDRRQHQRRRRGASRTTSMYNLLLTGTISLQSQQGTAAQVVKDDQKNVLGAPPKHRSFRAPSTWPAIYFSQSLETLLCWTTKSNVPELYSLEDPSFLPIGCRGKGRPTSRPRTHRLRSGGRGWKEASLSAGPAAEQQRPNHQHPAGWGGSRAPSLPRAHWPTVSPWRRDSASRLRPTLANDA